MASATVGLWFSAATMFSHLAESCFRYLFSNDSARRYSLLHTPGSLRIPCLKQFLISPASDKNSFLCSGLAWFVFLDPPGFGTVVPFFFHPLLRVQPSSMDLLASPQTHLYRVSQAEELTVQDLTAVLVPS